MVDLIVPSGAKVVIKVAPFEDAIALEQAIAKQMAIGGSFNLSTFMLVVSSPDVYSALMRCLVRCTYNNEKITHKTFDKEEARADFIPIASEAVRKNIGPFEEGLVSALSELAEYAKKQVNTDEGPKLK